MPSARRMGPESAKTRAQLVEAAAQILRDEGHAALTARRLAERVGLKRQIVHYYFRTIEDLLLAVARREGDDFQRRFSEAIQTPEPLKSILDLVVDATAMTYEFVALALRRKPIAEEMRRMVEKLRKDETEALARYLECQGIEPKIPPLVVSFVMRSVAQSMAVEASIGVSSGHAQTRKFVEDWLRAFAEKGELPADRSGAFEEMQHSPGPRTSSTDLPVH